MNHFVLDSSALVKRYTTENGSALIDHLLANASRDRLACLMLGAAEVAAALVRKQNAGLLSVSAFSVAMSEFRVEVLDAPDFEK